MTLVIRKNLPLGISWSWVKFSFATFREKPINFMVFAVAFLVFSTLPFIGSFVSVLALARLYLSAAKVINNIPFGLQLKLLEIFKQRNIVNYAVFNMFFDVFNMLVFSNILALKNINLEDPTLVLNHYVLLTMAGLSLFRIIFLGISLVILTFNPGYGLWQALLLSWKFILHNFVVLILGLFLLLPFLLVPLYISLMLVLSSESAIVFGVFSVIILIILLLMLILTSIFCVKLYADGIRSSN